MGGRELYPDLTSPQRGGGGGGRLCKSLWVGGGRCQDFADEK